MSAWLFIFGRQPELSFHELSALVDSPMERITPDVARVEDPLDRLSPQELMTRLGGTVKIARERGNVAALTAEAVLPFLKNEGESLTFGISLYGDGHLDTQLLRAMKESLERLGVRARYVAGHEGNTLSSVVITKQHVKELILVGVKDGYIVGETEAVQDFEAWNARDYGRPHADPKAGMLPPKVARMAVNLAQRSPYSSSEESSTSREGSKLGSRQARTITLLDPFCGMGTILGEALLAGWQVIGSDQSGEVVEKAKKNMEWLLTRSNLVEGQQGSTFPQFRLLVSDATHVSEHIPPSSVDAIVTEPFMGEAKRVKSQKSKVNTEDIRNIMKGLEKLYIGCLREWRKVLKPKGNIVIALPQYAVGGKTFFVKNVIDRCETFGYTVTLGPLLYSRPQAIVRRQFYIFQNK